MHSTNFETSESSFDSQSPENNYSLSLRQDDSPLKMDFSANPNILINIVEFENVVGLNSSLQAGLLVNQDQSCWLTNLGRNGSTEVYRPDNQRHRKLKYNQVAYLRHGDLIGFYGAYFRVRFGFSSVQFMPIARADIEFKVA